MLGPWNFDWINALRFNILKKSIFPHLRWEALLCFFLFSLILAPIPACTGWGVGSCLKNSPVCQVPVHADTQLFTPMFTPIGKLAGQESACEWCVRELGKQTTCRHTSPIHTVYTLHLYYSVSSESSWTKIHIQLFTLVAQWPRHAMSTWWTQMLKAEILSFMS